MIEHVAGAGVAMLLAVAAAPFGPFPLFRNLDFEPGAFVLSAAVAAAFMALVTT